MEHKSSIGKCNMSSISDIDRYISCGGKLLLKMIFKVTEPMRNNIYDSNTEAVEAIDNKDLNLTENQREYLIQIKKVFVSILMVLILIYLVTSIYGIITK